MSMENSITVTISDEILSVYSLIIWYQLAAPSMVLSPRPAQLFGVIWYSTLSGNYQPPLAFYFCGKDLYYLF